MIAFVALGSNLGNSREILLRAKIDPANNLQLGNARGAFEQSLPHAAFGASDDNPDHGSLENAAGRERGA